MANIFTNKNVNDTYFNMSNGLTSVFIHTLCISGLYNVNESFKKDILIWFAQRDWIILGIGFEGFDISEIIWDKSIFDMQKEFILETIDAVFKEKNWNLLNYTPNKEWLFIRLELFKQMIYDYKCDNINEGAQFAIFDFDEKVIKYEQCEKHRIYKHYKGCVVCNNSQ